MYYSRPTPVFAVGPIFKYPCIGFSGVSKEQTVFPEFLSFVRGDQSSIVFF